MTEEYTPIPEKAARQIALLATKRILMHVQAINAAAYPQPPAAHDPYYDYWCDTIDMCQKIHDGVEFKQVIDEYKKGK